MVSSTSSRPIAKSDAMGLHLEMANKQGTSVEEQEVSDTKVKGQEVNRLEVTPSQVIRDSDSKGDKVWCMLLIEQMLSDSRNIFIWAFMLRVGPNCQKCTENCPIPTPPPLWITKHNQILCMASSKHVTLYFTLDWTFHCLPPFLVVFSVYRERVEYIERSLAKHSDI